MPAGIDHRRLQQPLAAGLEGELQGSDRRAAGGEADGERRSRARPMGQQKIEQRERCQRQGHGAVAEIGQEEPEAIQEIVPPCRSARRRQPQALRTPAPRPSTRHSRARNSIHCNTDGRAIPIPRSMTSPGFGRTFPNFASRMPMEGGYTAPPLLIGKLPLGRRSARISGSSEAVQDGGLHRRWQRPRTLPSVRRSRHKTTTISGNCIGGGRTVHHVMVHNNNVSYCLGEDIEFSEDYISIYFILTIAMLQSRV